MGRCRVTAGSLSLRPALDGDLPLLRAWRNDPTTRAMMRRSHEFDLAQTRAWIFDEGRLSYMALQDQEPCGTVSFEPKGPSRFEVGIIIAPTYRGLGLGQMVLAQAHLTYPGATLEAHVRQDNAASLAMFRKAGFVDRGQHDDMIVLERAPS